MWASFGFCVTTSAPIKRLAAKHSDVLIKAQCDDILRAVRPPDNGDWFALYDKLAAYIADEDAEFVPLGLNRHPGKSWVVLPPGAPHPGDVLNVNGIPCAVKPGAVCSGAPFGHDDFITADSIAKAKGALKIMDATLDLVPTEPHMASHVLSSTAEELLS